jgi:hypothetical protein
MPDIRARQVLLVGSVPLDSSSAVFEAVAGSLGGLAKRIPDGETKERKDWIGWQANVMKNAKGLEPGGSREIQGGYRFTLYKVKNSRTADIEIGPLGYAAAALESYEDFKRLRSQGRITAGTRFQVSLPTPIAVVMSFCEPEAIGAVWPKYEERINQEVAEIVRAIPHADLAIQWDIAVEICFILEVPEMAKVIPMEALVAAIARISEPVPADVELGLHLCYGDPGHKHVVEPKDTGLMVEFANRLAAEIKRPIAWLHLPVPRDRDDVAYFAPLRGLKLHRETELYLGLVHLTDGVAGAQRRLDAAKQMVSEFGIATECGFGRRLPETVSALLELHRAVAHAG